MLINWLKKQSPALKFLYAAFAFTWLAGIFGEMGIAGLSISSGISAVICTIGAFINAMK